MLVFNTFSLLIFHAYTVSRAHALSSTSRWSKLDEVPKAWLSELDQLIKASRLELVELSKTLLSDLHQPGQGTVGDCALPNPLLQATATSWQRPWLRHALHGLPASATTYSPDHEARRTFDEQPEAVLHHAEVKTVLLRLLRPHQSSPAQA